MIIKLFLFITLLNSIPTEGRLIQKNKTKAIEINQTEKPNPTIRLTRDIEEDSLTGFSKEEAVLSDEFIQSYNRRAQSFLETKPKPNHTVIPKLKRVGRDSSENIKAKASKTEKLTPRLIVKPQTVLVKKPIPKFSDIDYEDDFQTGMSNSHIIFGDSVEHEDEDFNLGDYDFDVNHDEFITGRKPLEPRLSIRNAENEVAVKPEIEIRSKLVVPSGRRTTKRERSAKKSSEKAKEYNYHDDTSSTKPLKKKNNLQGSDNDYSEENDSKEVDHKTPSIRSIRSWDVKEYVNKFDHKATKIMTKLLSVLPMFPQMPTKESVLK